MHHYLHSLNRSLITCRAQFHSWRKLQQYKCIHVVTRNQTRTMSLTSLNSACHPQKCSLPCPVDGNEVTKQCTHAIINVWTYMYIPLSVVSHTCAELLQVSFRKIVIARINAHTTHTHTHYTRYISPETEGLWHWWSIYWHCPQWWLLSPLARYKKIINQVLIITLSGPTMSFSCTWLSA